MEDVALRSNRRGMRIVASNRYAYRMKFALLLSLFTSALLAQSRCVVEKPTTQAIQAAIDACSTREAELRTSRLGNTP